ncbi:MAG TPA: epoxide hydrolase [Allosphingosinicella sp.]|jgi:microsomal epoxide hydrolase|nr:epoxide hydrolase [Allosphingosinicella sp.]
MDGLNIEISPSRVAFGDAAIDDLRERLARTRWPDQPDGAGWTYGTDRGFLQDLCAYWARHFDWAACEARLNRYDQFVTAIDGRRVHFYHVRSPEPDARPLLLSHGWPGAAAEFLDVIGPLSDPASHGGDPRDAFHVIVPSLPGFGFSGPIAAMGYRARHIAADFAALMERLGYDRYFVHGGDKGTRIAMTMAADHPERVRAIHLGLMPAPPPDPVEREAGLSGPDVARVRRTDAFLRDEMAYQALQRTKPQSLAYGLTDSPTGLAAWLVEKFRTWSDCGGDLDAAMPRDRLLDMLNVYWFTGTIGSSMRSYFEDGGPGREEPLPAVSVPTGHTAFPAEIIQTPRAWAERRFDLVYWNEVERGGHFPALEVPDILAAELRACFRPFL